MKALVTGGCGFIGSNFILDWLAAHDEPVVNVDVLTYAANPATLASLTVVSDRSLSARSALPVMRAHAGTSVRAATFLNSANRR